LGFKEEKGNGVLGSINDVQVAQIFRMICAVNLQYLIDICKKISAFSIELDAFYNAGSSYLYIRMRFYFNGSIQKFHIMAIPMRDRHTGEYQFHLVLKLLDVIVPSWREQLIGIASDGASEMTGCIQGTLTRLANGCDGHMYRIWCGAHQINLVVKKT
jgi:hypothetical protein